MDAPNKNIVLVHGICTEGSIWRKVIPLLQQKGYEVTAAQIPNNTLEEDIGTVRRTLDIQQGPVILVGHSYAGMVISGIGKHPSVTRLVYIAALAPDHDETVGYLMSKQPASYIMEPISDEAGFLWPPRDVFCQRDWRRMRRRKSRSFCGPRVNRSAASSSLQLSRTRSGNRNLAPTSSAQKTACCTLTHSALWLRG